MHELSIAINIVEIASQEAARHRGSVTAVHVNVGALSGIVKESLISVWELATIDSPLEKSQLIVEELPAVAVCPGCQVERTVASIQLCRCSHCGSPLTDITRGRELEIVALELDG